MSIWNYLHWQPNNQYKKILLRETARGTARRCNQFWRGGAVVPQSSARGVPQSCPGGGGYPRLCPEGYPRTGVPPARTGQRYPQSQQWGGLGYLLGWDRGRGTPRLGQHWGIPPPRQNWGTPLTETGVPHWLTLGYSTGQDMGAVAGYPAPRT